ncbi:MAG: hypothetical protein ACRC2O_05310, partial [Chitinophagaceae bacterium]
DGYSDYIRHFLDGMAAIPEWAPAGEDHLLRSTSAVQKIIYAKSGIELRTFDDNGSLVIRMTAKPVSVTVNDQIVTNFKWKPLPKGGVFYMDYKKGNAIKLNR